MHAKTIHTFVLSCYFPEWGGGRGQRLLQAGKQSRFTYLSKFHNESVAFHILTVNLMEVFPKLPEGLRIRPTHVADSLETNKRRASVGRARMQVAQHPAWTMGLGHALSLLRKMNNIT